MEDKQGWKPSAAHPWRRSVKPDVAKWAYEQSKIPNVTNVVVAREATLHRRDPKVYVNGQM